MRIAHLETGRHLYGGAQQVLTLLDGLKARGHENILYALETSEIVAPAVLRGHRVNPIQLAGDHDAAFIVRFRANLKEDAPDLLHVHSRRGADTFGGVAAKLAGVPAVLSRRVDNPLTRASASLRFWPYRRVIAISNAVAEVLRGAGLASDRLAVIADAIDTSKLVLSPDMDWFRSAFHVARDAPVAGVVRSLSNARATANSCRHCPWCSAITPICRSFSLAAGHWNSNCACVPRPRGWKAPCGLPVFATIWTGYCRASIC